MALTSQTRKWYKNVKVPNDQSGFASFVAKFSGIIHMISGVEVEVTTLMPYAATDGKTIFIPATYFMDEFYENFSWPNGGQSIDKWMKLACINGSSIHEAMHVIRTGEHCDRNKFAALDPRAKKYNKNHKAFGILLNIVEDLHIEAYAHLFHGSVSRFLDDKNNVLFPPHMLDQVELNDDVSSIVNFLSFFKNPQIEKKKHDNIAKVKKYSDVLIEARDPGLEKKQRLDVAIRLWEMLMDDDEVEKDEEAMSDPQSGDDGSQEAEAQKQTQGTSSENGSGNDQQVLKQYAELDYKEQREMEQVQSSFNKQAEIEKMDDFDKFTAKSEDVEYINVKYYDILDYGQTDSFHRHHIAVNADPRFQKLGRFLRYSRQMKSSKGRPRNIGSKINRSQLHRIATDEKILYFKDHKRVQTGKPQVIFLIDLSGSMWKGEMYLRVLQAAKGAFISLMKSGIPCAVYAHTTYAEDCLVTGIASFQMPLGQNSKIRNTNDIDTRFVKASNMDKKENADGFAINFVGKCFIDRPGTKLFYVLSDGSPNAPGYRGHYADEHTGYAAEILRKKGIQVFSMSLVKGVLFENNRIYGKDYNYDLSGKNLDREFQTILKTFNNI